MTDQTPGTRGYDEAVRRFGADRVTTPRPGASSTASAEQTAPDSGTAEATRRFGAAHTTDTTS